MKIKKINLENFRNYERLELNLGPNINFIYGNNGQGKTNILEAIYLCTCARSHRTSKDSDLIKKNENFYSVKLSFYNEEAQKYNYEESLMINFDGKRKVFHDDIKLEHISDMMGIFNCIIFAPEDIQIIKDGPAARRRYIDLLLSQQKAKYFRYLSKAAKILNQRNSILKNLFTQNVDEIKQILLAWDCQLASLWVDIFLERYFLLKKIKIYCCTAYDEIAVSSEEKISLEYKPNQQKYINKFLEEKYDENKSIREYLEKIEISENVDIEIKNRLQQLFLELLLKNIETDLLKKVSNIGFHRDEIEICLNGEIIKSYASQGQMRSIVLALKIAELQYLSQINKQRPVLLLDDVLAELDEKRRKALLNFIKDEQVILTCTDVEETEKFFKQEKLDQKISYFYVENAVVKEEKTKIESVNMV